MNKIPILVVEDNAITRKMMRVALESAGYGVLEAADGKSAVRLVKKRPALILQDLLLPDIDGLDLVRQLRKTLADPRIPFLACTGMMSKLEEARAIRGGFTDYLFKPIEPSRLLQMVERYLTPPVVTAAPTSHPRPASDSAASNEEYVQRLVSDLEHQISRNAELMRRAAEDKAQLAVVAKITETLNQKLPLRVVLREALALILDAAGSSLGAIYLAEAGGKLVLQSQIGYNQARRDELQNFFGHSGLLYRASRENTALRIPSPDIAQDLIDDLRHKTKFPSLLVAPLAVADASLGILVAFSSRSELDDAWVNSVQTVTSQLAQAVVLARTSVTVSESERRFRELAENVNEIFFVTGRGGSPVHYVSPAYERITGRRCDDLYRNSLAWLENIHSEDRPRVEEALKTDPANLDQEYRVLKPGGEVRYLRSRSFPVIGDNGEVIRVVGIAEDRTERKLAEAQMSIQLAALESAANGIVITDRDGVITWVNPAFSKLTGYSSQEVFGQTPRLLKSDVQGRLFYQNLWQTILSGSVWSGETVNRRKDGTLYTEEQSITPVRDDKGRIAHFIAIKQDVTERKRAERQAQQNLERINALREIDLAISSTLDLHAVLAVLLEKIELFIPIAAASTVRLYNPRTGELESLACRGMDEPAWKAQQRFTTGRAKFVMSSKTPLAVRNVLEHPLTYNPETFRVLGLVSYLGVPLIGHEQVLGVLGLYTRQEHEFTDEEIDFFKTLAGQAAIAIDNAQLYEAVTRAKSGLEISNGYLNRSLRQLASLYTALSPLAPAESIQATMAGIVERLMEATGADAALIRLWDQQTGAHPITGHSGFTDEYMQRVQVAPRGGAVEWVIEHGQPIIAPDIASEPRFKGKVQLKQGLRSCAVLPLKVQNEVRGVVHIASRKLGYFDEEQKHHLTAIARQMGITLENKELFENLRASRDALEKANKIKDDFLSVMSHELKTPLVVVIGYAELLKQGTIGTLNEDQGKALQRVLRSAGQQLDIINNILQTVHLEAETIAPERQPVDVRALLDVLRAEYDKYAVKEDINLVWNYPAASVQISTDFLRLKQILQNLINNGIKFTNQGSVTISARLAENGKEVTFQVSDVGIGIPKEMQETIFNKFYQLDSSDTRLYGGVGLGLYVAKKLTELLGGHIEVESEPGKGSTFTVSVPTS